MTAFDAGVFRAHRDDLRVTEEAAAKHRAELRQLRRKAAITAMVWFWVGFSFGFAFAHILRASAEKGLRRASQPHISSSLTGRMDWGAGGQLPRPDFSGYPHA